MKINPAMFRAYDLRGIVNRDLNLEIVEHIGKAFGTYLKREGSTDAVIGFDCRSTSAEYSEALSRGLAWAGISVTNIGLNLVGTFYWAQYHLGIKSGAFVTASHNPSEYNGFKFAVDYSETMVSEQMNELCRMVQEDDIVPGKHPGEIMQLDIRDVYFKDVASRLPIAQKFKVLVDPSYSTAGVIVPGFLRKLGCEVVEKHCEIKSEFPLGTPDPTEEKVAKRLASEVLASGSDIGLTFDADGDRLGVVAENGTIIWNDVLVAIFAQDVLRAHPKAKIMYNTLCSKVVADTIRAAGGQPLMWRTGHSFLKKKNQEVGAAFVGELSGHFFFSADFYNHDDGFYSALRILHFMSVTGKKLSELIEALPKYISSPEIKIGCADSDKVSVIEKISQQARTDFPDFEIIDDERAGDGVRIENEDTMFVIRYSQNGPYLTVKFESRDSIKYEKIRGYLYDLLKAYSEISWGEDTVNVEALKS